MSQEFIRRCQFNHAYTCIFIKLGLNKLPIKITPKRENNPESISAKLLHLLILYIQNILSYINLIINIIPNMLTLFLGESLSIMA